MSIILSNVILKTGIDKEWCAGLIRPGETKLLKSLNRKAFEGLHI